MNIKEFKKGDEIVRVEPAKSLGSIGILGMGYSGGDRSFIGEKMIFIGIANGCLISQRGEVIDDKTRLPLDIWSDGWELWQDESEI